MAEFTLNEEKIKKKKKWKVKKFIISTFLRF